MVSPKKAGSPRFSIRPTRVPDLEKCYSLLRAPYAANPANRKGLLAFWRQLMESGSAATGVIEDKALGKRLVGFGMSFFASKSFARECLTAPPYLPLRAAGWRRGVRPFLNREEIAKANAGEGLVCVPLNFGMDVTSYGPPDLVKLQEAVLQMFFKVHGGFKITEFIEEVYGAFYRDNFQAMGLEVLRDFGEYESPPELGPVAEADRPCLMGAKPENPLVWKGSQVAVFFARYTPPHFYFRPGQQAVLEDALEGATDEEIAASRRLSIWSVKKRWKTIYEKVSTVDPELLGSNHHGLSEDRGAKQKRRHLLNYLKDHPEELRPLAVSRRRKSKA